MTNTLTKFTDSPFETLKKEDDNGHNYWLARELQQLLGYNHWRNFNLVVKKVQKSFENSFLRQPNTVADASLTTPSKMQVEETNNYAVRNNDEKYKVIDYKLSRQACYIIAMNCDPSKPEIREAQRYFAWCTIQMEEHKRKERERQLKCFPEFVISMGYTELKKELAKQEQEANEG
jgi:DNA-damage-inducible protein D